MSRAESGRYFRPHDLAVGEGSQEHRPGRCPLTHSHARRLARSLALAVSLLALACNEGAEPPKAVESTAAETAALAEPEAGLHVATFLRFRSGETEASQAAGIEAWKLYRRLIAPAEEDLSVATVLDDSIDEQSGDCGPHTWDHVIVQHYPDVATLGTVLRSPERALAIEHWDPAVETFQRVLGRPLVNSQATEPSDNGTPRHRILLARATETNRLQRAITAEAVFLGSRGLLWLQHQIPPDLNEVDNPWDVFTVTRFTTLSDLRTAQSDPELKVLRRQRDDAASRVCELTGRPATES